MMFYVFSDGFGVMAESEESARQTVREQWTSGGFWGEGCHGDPGEAAAQEIVGVVPPNSLVLFFC